MVFCQTITNQTFRIDAGRLSGKSVLVDTEAESLCLTVKPEQRRADRMKSRDNFGSEQAERNTV